jgi:hypothetical protein
MPKKTDRPDIEVGASVKAKKLRIDHKPDTGVRYAGDWTTASERMNLPDEVEPGATYRDVEVRWHVEARIAAHELDDEVGKPKGRKEP